MIYEYIPFSRVLDSFVRLKEFVDHLGVGHCVPWLCHVVEFVNFFGRLNKVLDGGLCRDIKLITSHILEVVFVEFFFLGVFRFMITMM